MSDERVFIDTNILVYAYDLSAGTKHQKAATMIEQLWSSMQGVLSTQVLQEFIVTVAVKIPRPMKTAQIREIVSDLLKWDVVVNDGQAVLEAFDLQQGLQTSFWDALIIHAALKSGANILYSEDLSHGRKVKGLRIENPLL